MEENEGIVDEKAFIVVHSQLSIWPTTSKIEKKN